MRSLPPKTTFFQIATSTIFWLSALAAPRSKSDVLIYGEPESVGMESKPLLEMKSNFTAYTHPGNYSSFTHYQTHPIQPGGAVMVAREGTIVHSFAFGKRNIYANVSGAHLPSHLQEDATLDTVYDMASVTKVFTSVAALREMDAGRIRLNDTVAKHVPGFEVNGKEDITIRMLVSHTSGFDADPNPPLYSSSYTTYEQRIEAIITQGLKNTPGSTYLYSDLNFMSLMLVLENVTGRKLDDLIRDFTQPMGMHSTFFNRNNLEGRHNPFWVRSAAQEFQIGPIDPLRPQPVRGTVHDENAWALGMILNNGTYGGHRILSHEAVDLIYTNLNARFSNIDSSHGVGFELNQFYTDGPLNTTLVASHTGYTGTSLAIDRGRNLFYIQFANRVHPSRLWSSNNLLREALGYWVGTSLGLKLPFPLKK
ncbi:beta-lactamase family protein [Thelonectria olida]|uniref:Beta-lactamase family protein n=1 Tax=Thelonectria olida TaxID=1576542 RepID=A0A9P8VW68_9HYPO|nr:beta-lactamase family protein [Thelonectria olida]